MFSVLLHIALCGFLVPPCNAMRGNLDNGSHRWSPGDRIVVLAPVVAFTGLRHRTGCIHETAQGDSEAY